jgi:dipeptidyl aminopeptidase/acylaminoacyl peptidase
LLEPAATSPPRRRAQPLRAAAIAAIAAVAACAAPATLPVPSGAGDAVAARAALLYVSDRPADHPPADYAADIAGRLWTERFYRQVTRGVVDYRKVRYRSPVGDLDIPAYVFQPRSRRGERGHAAMIWVHGGVHGNWDAGAWPFVREAVERGYIIIAPEYRGSTGYGRAFHEAIDYGGHEIDDVVGAYDWLIENLPHADPERVAIMGWSHGGYIAALAVMREAHPFRAAVAIVPVTNLIFRLAWHGPFYQRFFATQQRIRGLPFERRDIYVERSPVYHIDALQVPILVHLATNDADVPIAEAEMLVHALQVKKPHLAETRIYVDPPGAHSFARLVDPRTVEPVWTPEMRDSWNRTWTFLEWHLRPYHDRPRPPPPR